MSLLQRSSLLGITTGITILDEYDCRYKDKIDFKEECLVQLMFRDELLFDYEEDSSDVRARISESLSFHAGAMESSYVFARATPSYKLHAHVTEYFGVSSQSHKKLCCFYRRCSCLYCRELCFFKPQRALMFLSELQRSDVPVRTITSVFFFFYFYNVFPGPFTYPIPVSVPVKVTEIQG